jgi:hypothetical protein
MSFWDTVKQRLTGRPEAAAREPEKPILGAGGGRRDIQSSGPLGLPVLGGLGGIPPGPTVPPYSPKIPPQPPHEPPIGRPGWWSAALPQARLIYPDDQLNILLEELRRTVPILDRAITVLTGMVGRLEFTGPKSSLLEFTEWAHQVRINQTGRSLQTWLESHIDSMLLYGKGVTELVPSHQLRDVYALMNLDPRSIVFQVTADPLVLLPYQRQHVNAFLVELNPELLLLSVNGSHVDNPHGWSLYRSLPFVAQMARTIENATAQTWQRLGSPPFHINWEPPATMSDPQGTLAGLAIANLKAGWNNAMAGRAASAGGTGGNSVGDFFTAGKVAVSVIGHEHTPLPLAETWRVFEEQLVAVTGLPSWLLGFNWSTTQRMALQQSEILVANIESLRRHMAPALEQLVDLRQRLAGRANRIKLGWSPITLHDLTEQARAKAWEAQAMERQIANAVTMWQMGFWTQLQAFQALDPDAAAVAQAYETPPAPVQASGTANVDPSQGYVS